MYCNCVFTSILLVRKIIEVEQYLQFLLVCDFCCDFLSQTYLNWRIKMKLAIIKFSVGGLAVLISYIVSVVLPWKEFGGIFATFPAVF